MDDKDEDEEEQMVDMEIAVIDQNNDCSLIFSDSPSFYEVSDLVNDILNDQKIELENQECMNDLLDSVEKEVKIKKKLTRKRSINNMEWQRNKRKTAQEAGEEYVSNRGKKVAAKSIKPKKDCMSNCKFKCDKKIDKTSQEKCSWSFINSIMVESITLLTRPQLVPQHHQAKNQAEGKSATATTSWLVKNPFMFVKVTIYPLLQYLKR